jgi:hypothetical protein
VEADFGFKQENGIKLQILHFVIKILSVCWYFQGKGLPLQTEKK